MESLLGSFVASVLGMYLLLSNTLAAYINHAVFVVPLPQVVTESSEYKAPAPSEPQPIDVLPPSPYERGGVIPRVLIDRAASQPALVAGSPGENTSTTSSVSAAYHTFESRIVNITCSLQEGNARRFTTGSGVFVSERGVILTNAHVAQFLLLEGQHTIDTDCIINTGSPATARYRAKLLYIPPHWVLENATQLHESRPSGTGERDYALLYVTESVTAEPLPARFAHFTPRESRFTNSDKGAVVFVGGYPAEIIKTSGPDTPLELAVATTTLSEFYTFGSQSVDVIALAPSEVGEQGTSGGPVFSGDGTLYGLVTTRGNETEDGARSLRAITLPYISRTMQEETTIDLAETLRGDLVSRAAFFKKTLEPILSTIIVGELTE
jgi:S1-C subfamily serine protease